MTEIFLYIVAIVIHIITALYEYIIWKGNRGSDTYTTEDGHFRHNLLFILMLYIFVPMGLLADYSVLGFVYFLLTVASGRALFFNITYNYLRRLIDNNIPLLYFSPKYFFLDRFLHKRPKVGYLIILLIFVASSYLYLNL